MSDKNFKQETINKRKILLRSDAVVGDDDNKLKLDAPEFKSPKKHSLSCSKDSYTDISGIDIFQFISTTLHKNEKDREFLLKIEEELKQFIMDESITYHIFPAMSSYNRMLVHRIAAFFGLLHNVDQSGQQVVVSKHKGHTRLPDIEFRSLIKHSDFTDNKYYARRGVQSFDETTLHPTGKTFASLRNFRNRFYATNWSDEINRGRRARSFETGDWYGAVNIQQHKQSQQHSLTLNNAGETMSSNCSSTASSSAISVPMQAIHFPIYQYQPFIPFAGTETSLISPSNASVYSEPVPSMTSLPPMHYSGKPLHDVAIRQPICEKEQNGEQQSPPHQQKQQQQQTHIPSLFSVQPTPPQTYTASNQQIYSNQFQTYYQYQPVQGQPPVLPNQINAPIQYPVASAICYCYSPNYFPIYQCQPQTTTTIEPHPLLKHKKKNIIQPDNLLNSSTI